MHELIITHVVPAVEASGLPQFDDYVPAEPAHTVVYRFEFEDDLAIEASLGWLRSTAIAGGLMHNQPNDQIPTPPQEFHEVDPEFERLLAEEEEIERRLQAPRDY